MAPPIFHLSASKIYPLFSYRISPRPDHKLVTHGPYRWVQHPIYLDFLLMQIGIALLTANWLIGVTGVGLILAVIAARTPTEAAQLRERFGADYLYWMAGCLLLPL